MKDANDEFKVLLVDDEPYVREGLKGLIDWSRYGFSICGEASDGVDAYIKITKLKPHLVITDVRMPEMNGLELIGKATGELKYEGRFIILSGYGDFKYAQTAIKYGVKKYILKPIEEEELTEALREIYFDISNDIEKYKERQSNVKSKAYDAIKKLMKGTMSKEIAAFASTWLGIEEGSMMFVMIEVITMRQWISDMDSEEDQTSMADIHTMIIEAVGVENSLAVLMEEPCAFFILVNQAILTKFGDDESAFCRHLFSNISANGKYQIVIYAGKKVTNPEKLKDSYESCIYAKERSFFDRKCGTIFYDDVKSRSFNYSYTNEISYSNLLGAVASGKKDSIYELVENLFVSLKEKSLAPEMVRACMVSFMLDVVKVISDKKGNADMIFTRSRINSIQSMTASELEKSLYSFCISSMEYIQRMREINPAGIMADINTYIRGNYKNSISLKSVAEHFFIHPFYLGQLFNKMYGVYFNDYLNDLRIEEAGKLLKATDLKIHEIARQVGLTDSDYFVKKFKKIKGISPTQFRNDHSTVE